MKVPAMILTGFFLFSLSGCNVDSRIAPPPADQYVRRLDFTDLPRATISGEPTSYLELEHRRPPEAVRCRPVWDPKSYRTTYEPDPNIKTVNVDENITLTIKTVPNDYGQTFAEHRYVNQATGEAYSEFYCNDLLIIEDMKESDGHKYNGEWIGKGLILFRSLKQQDQSFFLFDIKRWNVSMIANGELKRRYVGSDGGIAFEEISPHIEPSTRLIGYNGTIGQLLVTVERESITLLEYNIHDHTMVTVLLENLPVQREWRRSDFGEGENLTAWFVMTVNNQPDQSGVLFQYNSRTKVLTPVLSFDDSQIHCYLQKEVIMIHNLDPVDGNVGFLYYDTGLFYRLGSSYTIYAVEEIGPESQECLITYRQTEQIHEMWNLSENKRYYLEYQDLIEDFPGGEWDYYSHGSGYFESEESFDGYRIDWYKSAYGF